MYVVPFFGWLLSCKQPHCSTVNTAHLQISLVGTCMMKCIKRLGWLALSLRRSSRPWCFFGHLRFVRSEKLGVCEKCVVFCDVHIFQNSMLYGICMKEILQNPWFFSRLAFLASYDSFTSGSIHIEAFTCILV